MRLINVKTFQFEDHPEPSLSPDGEHVRYAILSHRWSSDEVTFKDFIRARKRDGLGYDKIVGACTFVARFMPDHCALCYDMIRNYHHRCQAHEISHIWIDTCCIDKRSSAELSESINSMWNWYARSEYCLAYLGDVGVDNTHHNFSATFSQSDWFNRGWTLQELLAPREVIFCSRDWTIVGEKSDPKLSAIISARTGIEGEYLSGPHRACITQKFSLVARRQTTREEDLAYCLLGLLGVHMPLLYGEGGARAFRRLQLEIIAELDDESIFAWKTSAPSRRLEPVLALHPSWFAESGGIRSQVASDKHQKVVQRKPYFFTHKGIRFETIATPIPQELRSRGTFEQLDGNVWTVLGSSWNSYLVHLNCYELAADGRARYPCALILMARPNPSTPQDTLTLWRGVGNALRSPFGDFPATWEHTDPLPRRFFLSVQRSWTQLERRGTQEV